MSKVPTNTNGQSDSIAFLQDLDETGWETVFRYTDACPFRADDIVIRIGDTDRTLCIVTEGQLEVIVPVEDSRDYRRLALIDEGSVFGEQSFLDGRPRSAHIRAVTSGRMRVMSLRALERLADEEPKLAHRILLDLGRIVSLRLRQTTTLMNALHHLESES